MKQFNDKNFVLDNEVAQECSKCLRCDHYGFGAFKGGRTKKW